MKIKIVVLVSCFVSFFQIQAQKMLYKIQMEEQVNVASLIIEAQVVEKRSYLDKKTNHIYTINKVNVLKNFSTTEKFDYLYVVTKGGSIGFKTEKVTPSLQLAKGDIGTFFLNLSNKELVDFSEKDKIYKVYSDLQGFYKYDIVLNKVHNPFYTFTDIENHFYGSLTKLTKHAINVIKELKSKGKKSFSSAVVNSFTPTVVRAGTDENIIINGTGFGNNEGAVAFENADQGGGLANFRNVNNSAIVSWSDMLIEVRVPQFAGTGKIRVTDASGVNQFTSTDDLTVLSAETNAVFDTDNNGVPDTTLRVKLVNTNNIGGYTWTYNNLFASNTAATVAFEKSVSNWVCATGINWTIASNTSNLNVTTDDTVNLVRFMSPSDSNSDEIDPGTLGVTTSYFSGCQIGGGEIVAYLTEADMTFNSDVNWNFDETQPSTSQIDFQGTATHELGHAHNMGHVISVGQLMHFDTFTGVNSATRDIDVNTQEGALQNYEFSKTGAFCTGTSIASDKVCDSLSVQNFAILQDNETLSISSLSVVNKLSIFDLNGRLILTRTAGNEVSTSFISNGIYILLIERANGDLIYRKISI
ncbi:T9SS type A sorting domain-containing protein [Aquimarina agarilytica]|uniref:T9SS type A sorting domain-containing protein n=1 Tax=Aquimarina agarilytica TaxID=1087449 RepID=UPI00028970D8|nr:T9SS type A sorting domain-containing protein [Aquimarina agarilytica]